MGPQQARTQQVDRQQETDDEGLSRRRVLLAGTGTALGASVLVACGGSGGGGSTSSTATGSRSAGGGKAGQVLAAVADVPVGGAVSAKEADGSPVLVCRPTTGDIVAFSAICTHMGCTVAPADGELQCPCHGSTYDLATGDNTGGPAPRPLAKVQVDVRKGQVVTT